MPLITASGKQSPGDAVLVVGLPWCNDGVFVIAGTRTLGHTHTGVVQVHAHIAAAAVHRGVVDHAGVVGLTQRAAGSHAGGHVVAVHLCHFWTIGVFT